MKANIFKSEINTGILNKTDKIIIIKRNKFYLGDKWQPLVYKHCKSFNKKYVYFLKFMGQSEKQGIHISLNCIQNQIFLWLHGNNWIQKEENIRYIINILFLILGSYIGLKQIL